MIGKTFLFQRMSEALWSLFFRKRKNPTSWMSLWFAAIKSITGEAPGLNSAKSLPLEGTKLNLGYLRHKFIWIIIILPPSFKRNFPHVSGYCAYQVSTPLLITCFISIKKGSWRFGERCWSLCCWLGSNRHVQLCIAPLYFPGKSANFIPAGGTKGPRHSQGHFSLLTHGQSTWHVEKHIVVYVKQFQTTSL